MKNAIVLCSGGIDSVTTAYYVKKKLKYNKITLLFFNYGQKSLKRERVCVRYNAKKLGANFREMELYELGKISNSLINKYGRIKRLKLTELKDTRKEGAKWYVPLRNAVFLIYALALAESIYVKNNIINDIFVGFKSNIGEGYPDTSRGFLKDMERLTRYSKYGKYKIKAPFIKKEKEDIILIGSKLGVNLNKTFSCYVGLEEHCGVCLACRLRQEGFYWSNVMDRTSYNAIPGDFRSA